MGKKSKKGKRPAADESIEIIREVPSKASAKMTVQPAPKKRRKESLTWAEDGGERQAKLPKVADVKVPLTQLKGILKKAGKKAETAFAPAEPTIAKKKKKGKKGKAKKTAEEVFPELEDHVGNGTIELDGESGSEESAVEVQMPERRPSPAPVVPEPAAKPAPAHSGPKPKPHEAWRRAVDDALDAVSVDLGFLVVDVGPLGGVSGESRGPKDHGSCLARIEENGRQLCTLLSPDGVPGGVLDVPVRHVAAVASGLHLAKEPLSGLDPGLVLPTLHSLGSRLTVGLVELCGSGGVPYLGHLPALLAQHLVWAQARLANEERFLETKAAAYDSLTSLVGELGPAPGLKERRLLEPVCADLDAVFEDMPTPLDAAKVEAPRKGKGKKRRREREATTAPTLSEAQERRLGLQMRSSKSALACLEQLVAQLAGVCDGGWYSASQGSVCRAALQLYSGTSRLLDADAGLRLALLRCLRAFAVAQTAAAPQPLMIGLDVFASGVGDRSAVVRAFARESSLILTALCRPQIALRLPPYQPELEEMGPQMYLSEARPAAQRTADSKSYHRITEVEANDTLTGEPVTRILHDINIGSRSSSEDEDEDAEMGLAPPPTELPRTPSESHMTSLILPKTPTKSHSPKSKSTSPEPAEFCLSPSAALESSPPGAAKGSQPLTSSLARLGGPAPVLTDSVTQMLADFCPE